MTDVLTVGALGSVLLSRWKMLLAFVVVGVGVGVAYGMVAPPTYTSKAVLFVIAKPAEKDGYYQAAQFAEKRAATYPALLTAPQVLDRTRTTLGLDIPASALIPVLDATNPTDSSLVEVAATASTPQMAQRLAGTAAQYLADYAVQLEDSGDTVGAVTIKLAVPAREPRYPSSASPMVLGALGGLAGAALGIATALMTNAWRRRSTLRTDDTGTTVAASAEPIRPEPGAHPAHARTPAGAGATGTEPSTGSEPGDVPHTTVVPADAPVAPGPATGHAPRQRKRRRAHTPAGPVRDLRAVRAGAGETTPTEPAAEDRGVAGTVGAASNGAASNDAGAARPQNGRPAPAGAPEEPRAGGGAAGPTSLKESAGARFRAAPRRR